MHALLSFIDFEKNDYCLGPLTPIHLPDCNFIYGSIIRQVWEIWT